MPKIQQKKLIHGKDRQHTVNDNPFNDESSAGISQLATERQRAEESMANLYVIRSRTERLLPRKR